MVWQERRTVGFVSAGTRLTFKEEFEDIRKALKEDLMREAYVKRMLFNCKSVGRAVIL